MAMGKASAFAMCLTTAFQIESASATFSEVQQFRALIRAILAIRGYFHVEEYHGFNHQVYFNGAGAWGRTPARCELCDVVFVAYDLKPALEVRVTFLQAKLSRDEHPALCANYPDFHDPVVFNANLEQWDLLARRPCVLPVPPFSFPPLALQDAALPSIGSFGVFHRLDSAHIGFFYASADQLKVVGTPTRKFGQLETSASAPRRRTIAGHHDDTFCCCLYTFAESLYSLRIGTPVIPHTTGAALPQNALAIWLGAALDACVRSSNTDTPIARELLDALRSRDVPPTPDREGDSGGMPTIVVIKGERNDDSEAGQRAG